MSKKDPSEKNIDITSHFLIPKHSIINEAEKQELFSKYNITFKDLPKISINDAVVKNLTAKIGDIIKIERKSETAGTSIYYRGVAHV